MSTGWFRRIECLRIRKPVCSKLSTAHAFCNAHHLRELKALIELDEEPWAEMRDLLIEANQAVRQAREQGATALPPVTIQGFVDRYWEAIRLGLAFHRGLPPLKRCARGRAKRRPGHNLLERLKKYKDDVLRFLHDFSVPFTNNLAEGDLRMMKVKTKISGAFRTFAGACRFAALRSVVSTARKRAGTSSKRSPPSLRRSSKPWSGKGRLGSYHSGAVLHRLPWRHWGFAGWFEAYLGGRWYTFDPRNNMPRIGRVLIAQGRDAADVPITHTFGPNTLVSFKVWTDEVS